MHVVTIRLENGGRIPSLEVRLSNESKKCMWNVTSSCSKLQYAGHEKDRDLSVTKYWECYPHEVSRE